MLVTLFLADLSEILLDPPPFGAITRGDLHRDGERGYGG
tara:strand:+ start:9762 stop:9878 length:117 start_codon:yes stop_codon:yes gene_type:complete